MKNVIKESPVTIFLLALTTLVFIAMQVIYFGNATSNQAIFNTGGCLRTFISKSIVALSDTDICPHRLGAFLFQCFNAIFCWSNSRADLGPSQVFSIVCSIRNCWEYLYAFLYAKRDCCGSFNVAFWRFCSDYGCWVFWKKSLFKRTW